MRGKGNEFVSGAAAACVLCSPSLAQSQHIYAHVFATRTFEFLCVYQQFTVVDCCYNFTLTIYVGCQSNCNFEKLSIKLNRDIKMFLLSCNTYCFIQMYY